LLFTDQVFLFIFLPLTLAVYYLLPKNIFGRNCFLLLASSFFYYFGEQEKLLLMYFVILVNYLTGLVIYSGNLDDGSYKEKTTLQKFILALCVVVCVGLLWYYKYLNFTIYLLNSTLLVGNPVDYLKGMVLPLGISFYTFHVLSYTLDVYYGRLKVEKNLLNFASYVLMFPQLVAGPIVRYIDIKRQFYKRQATLLGMVNGIRIFCYGMGKKVLIANTVALYADEVFAKPIAQLGMGDCWLGALAYSLQIYFDFSGYSDMAIGIAMLFGFRYKENFNYPYIAKSAGEFWRRWHISLSSWLRDYVYIWMGGNRVALWRQCFNILLVFLCSGLWHGANLTFVCWGLLYGVFIVLETLGLKKYLQKVPILANLYLIILAMSGWVIFRSDSLLYAWEYLRGMYSGVGTAGYGMLLTLENNVMFALIAGIVFSYDWRLAYKKVVTYFARSTSMYGYVFAAEKFLAFSVGLMLFTLSVFSVVSSGHNPFIYFRF